MIRLLARLHGYPTPSVEDESGSSADNRSRMSALVGVVASSIVVLHLVALGFGGALLFIRSGAGYSRGETTMLAVMAVIAVLAFSQVGFRMRRRRRRPTFGAGSQ